jgi:hypothetical protein
VNIIVASDRSEFLISTKHGLINIGNISIAETLFPQTLERVRGGGGGWVSIQNKSKGW